MDRHSKKLIILAALLVALLMGGCGADRVPLNEGFQPDCTSQADCASGEVCVEGYCSVEDPSRFDLDFRFFPSRDTSYRPQVFENVTSVDGQRLNFGLEPAVNISSGSRGILYSDGSGGPSGNLIFTPVGIDDSRFTTQVRTDYESGFQVLLDPGMYTVTFVPESDSLPQKTWSDVEFTSSREFSRRMPTVSSLQRIEGFLTHEVQNPTTILPVPDATVYATAEDGKVISTASTTDSEGRFSFYVEKNVGLYDLHVGPSPANALVPSTVFEDVFEATDTGCLSADGSDIGCLSFTRSMGTYAREPVDVTINFEPVGFEPLGSRIVVRSQGFAIGTFSRTITVDSVDRAVQIPLYAGTPYEVEVLPPTDSQFASTTADFVPDPELDRLTLTMSMEGKTRVRGVLLDSNGRPLASERIEFTPDETAAASADEDIDMRTVSTESDENGQFEVFLEGIQHNVDIRPSAGSGLPVTRRSLSAADIRTSGPNDRVEVRLAQPRVLVGSVIGDSGMGDPLGGVVIRAYRTVDGKSQLVGEAQTDSSGSSRGDFRMVVSSELE
ncbi:MAG: hypothetical protein ACQEVA_04625 [Myxococcota bacterium]